MRVLHTRWRMRESTNYMMQKHSICNVYSASFKLSNWKHQEVDKNRGGSVDELELRALFKKLNINLTDAGNNNYQYVVDVPCFWFDGLCAATLSDIALNQ